MVFKKQVAGSQRTYQIMVRFRPDVKEQIELTIDRWIAQHSTKADPDKGIKEKRLTYSDFARMAIWEMCKLPNDPREP